MQLSRREILLGITGAAVTASAAERISQPARISERRVYAEGSIVPPAQVLARSGIRVESARSTTQGTEYLFTFDSLEQRTQAWDRCNTDAEWCVLRKTGAVLLREIAIAS